MPSRLESRRSDEFVSRSKCVHAAIITKYITYKKKQKWIYFCAFYMIFYFAYCFRNNWYNYLWLWFGAACVGLYAHCMCVLFRFFFIIFHVCVCSVQYWNVLCSARLFVYKYLSKNWANLTVPQTQQTCIQHTHRNINRATADNKRTGYPAHVKRLEYMEIKQKKNNNIIMISNKAHIDKIFHSNITCNNKYTQRKAINK